MVTPGEAATIKVEPSLLKPAARTSSVPVMVNGSRCPASCSAAMAPARINSRQPWPVRFGSRPPAMPQTSINSPATGPMPNAGRSSWVEPVALLVPGTDNYRAGGHLDNPSALVADNQEEVGHGREADLRKAAHGHVPNLLPPRNHPMIMPEVRPASSSAALRAATLARICRGHGVRLELEVEAQGFVELSHQVGGNSADHWAQPFDGHGPDLFGLRL